MFKLFIIFKDKCKVTYIIRRGSWVPYFNRHAPSSIKSAILQKYPKKDNEPIILIDESEEN